MDENNYTYIPPEEEPKKAKKKKRGTPFKVILVILLCCLVAGVLTVGGQTIYNRYQAGGFKGIFKQAPATVDDPKLDEPPVVIVTPSPEISKKTAEDDKNSEEGKEPAAAEKKDQGEVMSAAELYEKNVNAMVSISTSIEGYNAWGQRVQGAAAGSGFIVSKDGYILTNAHVIEDASEIKVSTYEDLVYEAELVGYDQTKDIAVLKIYDTVDFQPAVIGDSDKCKVGEEVVAIGNSLGEFDFSMTRGIISGLARNVTVSSNLTMSLIQTDCTINSGNSGGALFNMKGEVIGITNAKYSSPGTSTSASIENVGFAIPINDVIKIVQAIVTGEHIETPYIGVTCSQISNEVADATGIKNGVYISDVNEGGPADKAGIMKGDIIVKAGDSDINEFEDLSSKVASCKGGDELEVVLYRQGKEMTLTITVGTKADSTIVMGSDLEKEKKEKEQKNQEYQNGVGGGNSYYGGYGSMPDIFEKIFGDSFGYGYGY